MTLFFMIIKCQFLDFFFMINEDQWGFSSKKMTKKLKNQYGDISTSLFLKIVVIEFPPFISFYLYEDFNGNNIMKSVKSNLTCKKNSKN